MVQNRLAAVAYCNIHIVYAPIEVKSFRQLQEFIFKQL
jgi:hypothetical protein